MIRLIKLYKKKVKTPFLSENPPMDYMLHFSFKLETNVPLHSKNIIYEWKSSGASGSISKKKFI